MDVWRLLSRGEFKKGSEEGREARHVASYKDKGEEEENSSSTADSPEKQPKKKPVMPKRKHFMTLCLVHIVIENNPVQNSDSLQRPNASR